MPPNRSGRVWPVRPQERSEWLEMCDPVCPPQPTILAVSLVRARQGSSLQGFGLQGVGMTPAGIIANAPTSRDIINSADPIVSPDYQPQTTLGRLSKNGG